MYKDLAGPDRVASSTTIRVCAWPESAATPLLGDANWQMGKKIGAARNLALRAKPRFPLPGGDGGKFRMVVPIPNKTEALRKEYGEFTLPEVLFIVFQN
jgi:hypothetical protein